MSLDFEDIPKGYEFDKLGHLKISQGLQGPAGPKGDKGDKGDIGATGSRETKETKEIVVKKETKETKETGVTVENVGYLGSADYPVREDPKEKRVTPDLPVLVDHQEPVRHLELKDQKVTKGAEETKETKEIKELSDNEV